jgi:quercetin 2,3-dioxygenase
LEITVFSYLRSEPGSYIPSSMPHLMKPFFSIPKLERSAKIDYQPNLASNGLYLFVLYGEVKINGRRLESRDGLGIQNLSSINIKANDESELLFMEAPV